MCPRLTRLWGICLAALFLAAPAAPAPGQATRWSASAPADEWERTVVEAWRQRQTEIRGLQERFLGSVEGFDLQELGMVAFVLEQARRVPRRFLDPLDHNLVFSAVEGQNARELETNLPAMVNYIRLSMSANAFLPAARLRKPLVGRRKGMETLLEIARSVYDFRSRQLGRVRAGEIPSGQVLTKANLGVLGDRATLARLEQAYDEGHDQFTLQRNLVVLGVLAVQLQFGFVVALWIRRKAEGLVVVRGGA
jgi:multidrug efflux pump subunit AcrA (membrane-fusion protein)